MEGVIKKNKLSLKTKKSFREDGPIDDGLQENIPKLLGSKLNEPNSKKIKLENHFDFDYTPLPSLENISEFTGIKERQKPTEMDERVELPKTCQKCTEIYLGNI